VHWIFAISMFLPFVGGPVENLTFTVDKRGCEVLLKIVKAQLDDARLKYHITECWRSDWSSSVHGYPPIVPAVPSRTIPNSEVR